MEQEIIDLSHLTAEERAKLVAVIEADEELRLNCLRYCMIQLDRSILARYESSVVIENRLQVSCTHDCIVRQNLATGIL